MSGCVCGGWEWQWWCLWCARVRKWENKKKTAASSMWLWWWMDGCFFYPIQIHTCGFFFLVNDTHAYLLRNNYDNFFFEEKKIWIFLISMPIHRNRAAKTQTNKSMMFLNDVIILFFGFCFGLRKWQIFVCVGGCYRICLLGGGGFNKVKIRIQRIIIILGPFFL